jgi:Flp pilus assembly protein TadD
MLTTELIQGPLEGTPNSDALAPEDLADLESLARIARQRGKYADARDIVHGLIVLQRENPRFWMLLGEIERDDDELDAAWSAMNQALELDTTYACAVALADVHLLRGDLERAEDLIGFVRLNWPADNDENVIALDERLARQRDGSSV